MRTSAKFGQSFRFCNGRSVGNLYEFLHILWTLKPQEFAHHVNPDRNDFYNWILYGLKLPKLANRVAGCKTKQEVLQVIQKFIASHKSQHKL